MDQQHADRVIAEAKKWLGTPYRHQASTTGIGCDCLGLLRGVWRGLYGKEPESIPPYAPDWDLVDKQDVLLAAAKRNLDQIDELELGAVLIFRWRVYLPARHLAIVTAENKIIHAYERAGVVETTLGTPWKNRIAGMFRFPHLQFENE